MLIRKLLFDIRKIRVKSSKNGRKVTNVISYYCTPNYLYLRLNSD